jgi:predicted RNase H-like HicB family nuclease
MAVKFVLSEYIVLAMAQATYDKLNDGTFAGRIPSCPGVIAFAVTLRQCEEEFRSTVEDWLLVGLKMGYSFPGLDMASLS